MNSSAKLNGAGLAGSHLEPIRLLSSKEWSGTEAHDRMKKSVKINKTEKRNLAFIKSSGKMGYIQIYEKQGQEASFL